MRKYCLLYSPRGGRKPGPKGPSREVIKAIVEMKQRNPRYGCPRIAQQINLAFGLERDKDIVRRVLAIHYKPDSTNSGPSWLTTLGHAKDSLWSVDLFRAESITLKTHWIMVVMDQYARRSHPFVEPLIGASGVNSWIRTSSGPLLTWTTSSGIASATTISIGAIT